jgi:hypothetical protein
MNVVLLKNVLEGVILFGQIETANLLGLFMFNSYYSFHKVLQVSARVLGTSFEFCLALKS